jgi:PTS system nitrogen regulatory IIA component
MSTGIGQGIAIPHARIEGVENIIFAVGINKDGIDDYESLDGTPVRLIFMIIAGEKKHQEYLMLLSQIVKIFKKDSRINQLLETEKAEEIIGLISDDFIVENSI